MKDSRIDAGKPFDWSRISEDYARYRDIYPQMFYDRILAQGLCIGGQTVLDLGTDACLPGRRCVARRSGTGAVGQGT